MDLCSKRRATALTAAAALASLLALHTSDPCAANGYGTKAKGMAGAGIALPQDATAARLNPAGMAFVSKRFDLSMAAFNADQSYTVSGVPSKGQGTFGLFPETVKSGLGSAVVPTIGLNWSLGERRSLGVTVYGLGGMNTSYPGSAGGGLGTFLAGPAGVSIEQLFVLPTYAARLGDASSWGVSAVLVSQRFKATGLGNMAPFVSDQVPDNLSDRGYDGSFGVGAKVGLQGKVLPRLTGAVSYQTQVHMSRFKKYSDLFVGHGAYDTPPTAMAGLAWEVTPASRLVFDVENVRYSRIPTLSNPFSNLAQGVATQDPSMLLGGANGPGFGWRDVTTCKLGWQWQSSRAWTWRAGVSYGRQPIRSSEMMMNMLAPGVQEWRMTTGLTRQLGEKNELNLSLMFAPAKAVRGPNPLENPGQQSIELKSRQIEVEASWARKF